jgi:hypothetical protein
MLRNIRDRMLQVRIQRDERWIKTGFLLIAIVIVLLVFNLIYLNLIAHDSRLAEDIAVTPTPESSRSAILTPTGCDDCVASTPTTAPAQNTSVVNPQVKDYFIPLGSGTVQSQEWTNVPGVEATVDFGDYQNIQSVLFEASISLPAAAQTVSVQLFNVTANQPVWNSMMSTNGSQTQYLVSQPLIYTPGLNTYQVQMQTQLLAPATLVQSRIHIILE